MRQHDPDMPGQGPRTRPGNRGTYVAILGAAALAVIVVLFLMVGDGEEPAPLPSTELKEVR